MDFYGFSYASIKSDIEYYSTQEKQKFQSYQDIEYVIISHGYHFCGDLLLIVQYILMLVILDPQCKGFTWLQGLGGLVFIILWNDVILLEPALYGKVLPHRST